MGYRLESGNSEIMELDTDGLENWMMDDRFGEIGNALEDFEDCGLADAEEARPEDMGKDGLWESGDGLAETGREEIEALRPEEAAERPEDGFEDCMLCREEERGNWEYKDNFESAKEPELARVQEKTKIHEVAEGVDEPGKTDYFIDRGKAEETLMPFKQEQWEQMPVEEQKASVEKLAGYNAEILDIENPPDIVYYENESPSDYGGYSESQHAILINERNMGDGAEAADTISHEYRHCYQHERAEKLENERDLAFREGFEQYIRPENDYAGYKNQLVERDARAYADAVRDKIASLEKREIE